MQVDAASVRDAAAAQREVARAEAATYAAQQSDLSHDQRVEEAKKSAAARPGPADRAAELPAQPERPLTSSGSRLLDVLA